MEYTARGRAAAVGAEEALLLMECETCGALVYNTVAHDRHHAELTEAVRQARSAYSLSRPIG